jgi:DNA-binding MarR family transcriptional regulator
MSVRIMADVWARSTQSGGKLLVLLALADNADDERRHAWPSVETLAKKARLSPRQVKRVLTELVAAGELEVVREGGGRGKPTLYRVLPKNGAVLSGSEANGDADDHETVSPVSPEPSIEPSRSTADAVDETSRAAFSADVVRLCDTFSELARQRSETPESSGKYRPTRQWLVEMDRLLRIDGRSPAEVEAAIRWVHTNPFWASNILSVSKLRKQYDTIRLQAQRDTAQGLRLRSPGSEARAARTARRMGQLA